MKHFKYIAILFAWFAVACTTDDLGETVHRGNQVKIVGRVMPFTECNVGSRAIESKLPEEAEVQSMNLLIFGKDENDNLQCVYREYREGSDMTFNINRGTLVNGKVENSSFTVDQAMLAECYIYVVSNFPELDAISVTDLGVGTDVSVFMNLITNVNGIVIPDTGLPMVGFYAGDQVNAKPVNLQVGGQIPDDALNVKMKSLFAKVMFEIRVEADQKIGNNIPTFVPNTNNGEKKGVVVNNVVNTVDLNGIYTNPNGMKESEPGQNNGSDDGIENKIFNVYPCDFSYNANDGITSFYFYLPERYLAATKASNNYQYPFGIGTSIRQEDLKYRQRFKPLLVDKSKKATYVTFSGTYTDHQSHVYDVSYDIYLGNDNYGNFDIVGNTQYNNIVTIRGLANSNDQSSDKNSISIDHRVAVDRVDPIIINFRRETLLDSHFEIRPIRIRKNPKYEDIDLNDAKVKVVVNYGENIPATGKNWIGLERSYGNGNSNTTSTDYLKVGDLVDGRKNSAGKRKYFTTNLTTNTLAGTGTFDGNGFSTVGGTTVIVPVTDSDQCIWMYVDECTETGDALRTAIISISYAEDGVNYDDPINYVINQRKLFPVFYTESTGTSSTSRQYLIEYHEEYLHNYDADDSYGQTEEKGMQWGLNGVQLSYDTDAIFFESGWGDFINTVVNVIRPWSGLDPKYDFYIPKHDSNVKTEEVNAKRAFAGYTFCDEIIDEVNGQTSTVHNTDPDDNITILTLGQDPKSAVEYCYNKNKRNADGTVPTVEWYLPAIDEIEDIVMSKFTKTNIEDGTTSTQNSYIEFMEFQNNFYWSSQPAYIRNYAYYNTLPRTGGDYYYDDINYARATSVSYSNNAYNYEESGTIGYYNGISVKLSSLWNPSDTKTYGPGTDNPSATLNGKSFAEVNRQPGNLHRTEDMARVRCVKKVSTTTN